MIAIIQSEFLKCKRTFPLQLIWIMPLVTLILTLVLMGGQFFQYGAYNWWYTLLLPGSLAIFCAMILQRDAKMKYRSLLPFPIDPARIWLGKVSTGLLFLLSTSCLFFCGVTIGGYLLGQDVSFSSSLLASLILLVTCAWQIPLCMLLTAKIGLFATVLINILGNLVFSVLSIKPGIWLIPYAIPARLMCPLLQLGPNGIPLETGSALTDTGVIIPGLLISIFTCIIFTAGTALHFRRQEAK